MRFFKLTIVLFAILISCNTYSQLDELTKANKYLNKKGEVFFKFTPGSTSQLNDLSRILSIDEYENGEVYAYANSSEFEKFLEYNFDFTVLLHPGDMLENPVMGLPADKGIWDFDTYPTYEEYEAMMYQFETDYPNLCEIVEIGTTVDGRKLLFAKISDNINQREVEPRFMYTSTMHGDETVGYILMLRLINHLLSNYGSDAEATNLVNNLEIWIMPLENPDGTYTDDNSTVAGATRYNANNIDLNRNYKNPAGGDHPDGNPWQPENIAMMGLLDTVHFVMSANCHGGIELANYAWDSWLSTDNPHADQDWWIMLAEEYRDEVHLNAPDTYFTGQNNGVTHGGDWYVVKGSRQDYMCYYNRGRELTLELSNTKLLPTNELQNHWNYNYQSILNYLKQCKFGIIGIVTDACTNQPIVANIFINSHDNTNTDVFSELPHGDYYRPINAGDYSVTISAPGYVSQTFDNITVANNSQTILNAALETTVPTPPIADFSADNTTSCTGVINFTDQSTGANTYAWDFGDGNTSDQQNPTHIYITSGTYNVSLTVTNCLSNDQEVKNSYITINLPVAPTVISNENCGPASLTLNASGNGILEWYDAAVNGNLLYTGNSYTTPLLSASQSYYVQDNIVNSTTYNVGETASSTYGGYHNSSNYYIIFDCFEVATLNSVEINAEISGDVSVDLRNSSGATLQSTTVNAPQGISRIDLNFDLPVANDMYLVLTSGGNLWRNDNTSSLSFPYLIDGIINLKTTNATPYETDYYYYFYDWEVSISNNCSSSRVEVSANIYNIPTVNVTTINETQGLSDGSATANASNGTSPYSYQWDANASNQISQTAINLSTGIYFVTITDDNGCNASSNGIVGEDIIGVPPVADFTASDDQFCVNTTINFTDNSSNIPTSWSWTFEGGTPNSSTEQNPANINYTTAGTYQVILAATNENGTDTETKVGFITVTSPATIELTGTDIDCFENNTGEVTANITGGTEPFQILWSNDETIANINDLVAGTYTVTITDNNSCASSESITLTQPTALEATYNVTDASVIGTNDGAIDLTVTGGTPTYEYNWSNQATTEDLTDITNGNYFCTVTDANGCQTDIMATVSYITDINIIETVDLSIYPNPTNGIVNIVSNTNIETIEIIDILGNRLFKSNINNNNAIIDMSKYSMGVYFIEISNNNNRLLRKVVVSK